MQGPQQQKPAWVWTRGRLIKLFTAIAIYPICLCGVSGRWSWPQAWFIISDQLLCYTITAVYISRHNPSLLSERERFIRNAGTAGFDKILAPAVVALALPMYLAAGLQQRWHAGLLPATSAWQLAAAAAVHVLTVLLACWAMTTNKFFSSVVRIQTDRGHVVCDSGPYAYIRHPAYIAVVVQTLAEALLLQSSWLLWIGAARAAVLAARTAAEDAMLLQQLPGYAVYAARVKYRWLPLLY
ncbi:hypothetical protein OEZ86_006046 [Tetradesmus obliquus]|nr:hypothetical protein OEZ86_006046 [Tetradesmus obliquus]